MMIQYNLELFRIFDCKSTSSHEKHAFIQRRRGQYNVLLKSKLFMSFLLFSFCVMGMKNDVLASGVGEEGQPPLGCWERLRGCCSGICNADERNSRRIAPQEIEDETENSQTIEGQMEGALEDFQTLAEQLEEKINSLKDFPGLRTNIYALEIQNGLKGAIPQISSFSVSGVYNQDIREAVKKDVVFICNSIASLPFCKMEDEKGQNFLLRTVQEYTIHLRYLLEEQKTYQNLAAIFGVPAGVYTTGFSDHFPTAGTAFSAT